MKKMIIGIIVLIIAIGILSVVFNQKAFQCGMQHGQGKAISQDCKNLK